MVGAKDLINRGKIDTFNYVCNQLAKDLTTKEPIMAFEHKENTATVFNNDKKSADNQPDYTGRGKVGDDLMDFAMWKRTSKSGTEYFYMSFKKPQEKYQNTGQSKPAF